MTALPLDAVDPSAWLAKHLAGCSISSTRPVFISKQPYLFPPVIFTPTESYSVEKPSAAVSLPATYLSSPVKKDDVPVFAENPQPELSDNISPLLLPIKDETSEADTGLCDYDLFSALDEIEKLEMKSLEAVGYENKAAVQSTTATTTTTTTGQSDYENEALDDKVKMEDSNDMETDIDNLLPLLCCRCMEWNGLCGSEDFSRPECCKWNPCVDLAKKQPNCLFRFQEHESGIYPVHGLVGELFEQVIYSMLDDRSLLRLSLICTTLYNVITKWLGLWNVRMEAYLKTHFRSSFEQEVVKCWRKDVRHLSPKAQYDKLKFFYSQQQYLALEKHGIGRPSVVMNWAKSWHPVHYTEDERALYKASNFNEEPPRRVQYFRGGKDIRRERNNEFITHITFTGGVFYVPDAKLDEFRRAYVEDLQRGVNLYICEHPTDAFPFFLDVDLIERDLPSESFFQEIVKQVIAGADEATDFEASTNSAILVYKVATSWRKTKDKTARHWRYKTGLHIFWQNYFVDPTSARHIRNAIVEHLIESLGERDDHDNAWCVAVDDAVYKNGLRLFGSYRAENCSLCRGSGILTMEGQVVGQKKNKKTLKMRADNQNCHPKYQGQAILVVKSKPEEKETTTTTCTAIITDEDASKIDLEQQQQTQPCYHCLGAKKVHIDRPYHLWCVIDGFSGNESKLLYERYVKNLDEQFGAISLRRPELCKEVNDKRVHHAKQLPAWVRAIKPADLLPPSSLKIIKEETTCGKRKSDGGAQPRVLPSSTASGYAPKRLKQDAQLVQKINKAIQRRYHFMREKGRKIVSVDFDESSNYFIAKTSCKWCPNIGKEHNSSTIWFAVGPHYIAVHCFSRKAILRPVGRCYCSDMRAEKVKTPHKLRKLLFPAIVAQEEEQQKLAAQFDLGSSSSSDYVQVVSCPLSSTRKRKRIHEDEDEDEEDEEK